MLSVKDAERRCALRDELLGAGYEGAEKGEVLDVYAEDDAIRPFLAILARYPIDDLREKKETLEEFFMSFYKEDLNYAGI